MKSELHGGLGSKFHVGTRSRNGFANSILLLGVFHYCTYPQMRARLRAVSNLSLINHAPHNPYIAITILTMNIIRSRCAKKYGKDWEQYCSIVKWRFIPYVY